jgi:hypothetical protein
LVGLENVRKTEAVDNQRLPKMSIFGRFRTKIFSSSKRCPFLGAKIQNFLDSFIFQFCLFGKQFFYHQVFVRDECPYVAIDIAIVV